MQNRLLEIYRRLRGGRGETGTVVHLDYTQFTELVCVRPERSHWCLREPTALIQSTAQAYAQALGYPATVVYAVTQFGGGREDLHFSALAEALDGAINMREPDPLTWNYLDLLSEASVLAAIAREGLAGPILIVVSEFDAQFLWDLLWREQADHRKVPPPIQGLFEAIPVTISYDQASGEATSEIGGERTAYYAV